MIRAPIVRSMNVPPAYYWPKEQVYVFSKNTNMREEEVQRSTARSPAMDRPMMPVEQWPLRLTAPTMLALYTRPCGRATLLRRILAILAWMAEQFLRLIKERRMPCTSFLARTYNTSP